MRVGMEVQGKERRRKESGVHRWWLIDSDRFHYLNTRKTISLLRVLLPPSPGTRLFPFPTLLLLLSIMQIDRSPLIEPLH